MAARAILVPYEDLKESKEATFERKTQSQALELQGSFDPFSQGKKRHFLWKGHDLIKKNTLEVTSFKHAGKPRAGSCSLLSRLKQDHEF